MRKRLSVVVLAICGLVVGSAYSQPTNPTQQRASDDRDQVPVYRVRVVAQDNSRNQLSSPRWCNDDRLPRHAASAEGARRSQSGKQAGIHRDRSRVRRSRAGDGSSAPSTSTYVMWAITPEGRATNLGEVLLNDETESKLNVTTELQAFGLVVTAEPYFAVSQPSDVVVMENVIRRDTRGKVEHIDAKYELLTRGILSDEHGSGSDRCPSHGPQDAAGAVRSAQCRAALAARRRRSLRCRNLSEGFASAPAGRRAPGARARPPPDHDGGTRGCADGRGRAPDCAPASGRRAGVQGPGSRRGA